jgi:ubiquinone biosynthesis protein UbiJ
MLDPLASQAVHAVLNRLLAREPWAREKLAPFAGRAARFEFGPLTLTLAIVEGGSVGGSAAAPDVTIALDPAAAPAALFDPAAVLRNVRLSGDAEFAQALSFVLQNLRPEPEEELARFVGDAAAVRIMELLRAVAAQVRDGGQRLAVSAADYFVAENPMLAARDEVNSFGREVHLLRDAVERLDKRIERLERVQRDRLARPGHDDPAGPG